MLGRNAVGCTGAFEGVGRPGVGAAVGVDGGLDGGEPWLEFAGVFGVRAGRGEVVQRGGAESFGVGELGGVAEGYGGGVVVVGFDGDIEGLGVVGAGGHGVAEVLVGEAAGEGGDAGEVAEQAAAFGGGVVAAQGVGGHLEV